MVDWKNMAAGLDYPEIATNGIPNIAGAVIVFLKYLKLCHSVSVEQVSIAGHSLGAHIGMFHKGFP